MKKYIVEYLVNGSEYNLKTFTDYETAMNFYNRVRRREWARLS